MAASSSFSTAPRTRMVALAIVALSFLVMCQSTLAAGRMLAGDQEEQQPSMAMEYHNGHLLTGPTSVNLIFYGKFTPAQRAIVSDFITSLSSTSARPSVSTWWSNTLKLYTPSSHRPASSPLQLSLVSQTLDDGYSLGRRLRLKHIVRLASAKGGAKPNSVNIVLTAADVVVDGFCSIRCGTHGSSRWGMPKGSKFAYIWVGNSATQCPGHCAWPFHRPIYGPQTPALVAPNNDVGVDGMVINIASLLANTVTNPFGKGYFQGPAEAPLEAASACAGVYGKGAYPGYAGELLVDATTGASYNAQGVNGRKYLLPAVLDPSTSKCSTLA